MKQRRIPESFPLAIAMAITSAIAPVLPAPAHAQGAPTWVVPRTPDGHPDLQGNWSNGTLTPLERPPGLGRVLTPEQVARIEKIRSDTVENLSRKSDPDRPAPPKGGDGSVGAAGNVGGYNYFWIDAGNQVATVNGERRSSLLVDPPDGRIPPLTAEARQRQAEFARRVAQYGEYDNPENRPLAERCITSFGSNAGPPMLPNYFYNNNYSIVQTKDHVMVLTEMVHDARIIRIGKADPPPRQLRPWMGVSFGRWEGDTLVVETTNLSPRQSSLGTSANRRVSWSDNMKVIERFHRADEHTILYRFTVTDPTTFTLPWSGEVPFVRMDEQIYEYACHEANYALSNILSGERAREREAAHQPKP